MRRHYGKYHFGKWRFYHCFKRIGHCTVLKLTISRVHPLPALSQLLISAAWAYDVITGKLAIKTAIALLDAFTLYISLVSKR
jgi:hypothetical protein